MKKGKTKKDKLLGKSGISSTVVYLLSNFSIALMTMS